MPNNDVSRREILTQPMGGVEQSLVVRNKNLNVIAKLGQLGGRTDKIWNGTGGPVPDENLKTFSAQIRTDPATDDPEANHSYRVVL